MKTIFKIVFISAVIISFYLNFYSLQQKQEKFATKDEIKELKLEIKQFSDSLNKANKNILRNYAKICDNSQNLDTIKQIVRELLENQNKAKKNGFFDFIF